MRVSVPLDRSGVVPGTVDLHVERSRARNAARPPLFLIAGGPGQSATRAFGPGTVEELVGTERRSRDIVVMDLRGTGRSGALSCPALQRGSDSAADSAACAARIGSRRDFYSSSDMADDIDAVRRRLGVERIALYGVSYGTHVALTYARMHPGHVDRLVLNSVVGPGGVDAFQRSSSRALPRVVGAFCGKRHCRSFTSDAAADVIRLARRLERRPVAGLVTDRRGRRHHAELDGQELFELIVAGDANPFLRAEVPGAIDDALRGDPARLLRAEWRASRSEGVPVSSRSLSAAAYVATLCTDTALPWSASTPIAGRGAAAAAFATAQPAGAFYPFGPRTALASDVLKTCRRWPSSPRPPRGPVALPDVPALLLGGSLDARTPVENAHALAAELPQAKLLAVGNAGHGAFGLFDSPSRCVGKAIRRFLAGGDPGRCGAVSRFIGPLPPFPAALRALIPVRGIGGRAGRTAQAVRVTVFDGLLSLSGEVLARVSQGVAFESQSAPDELRTGALRGGSYFMRMERFGFRRATVVRGVRVSGHLRMARRGARGVLRVSGTAASTGRLVARRGVLRGALGGRAVRVPLRLAELLGSSAKSSKSSQPARLARLLTQRR